MSTSQIGLFAGNDIEPAEKTIRLKPVSASKFISSVWSFPGGGGDQLYRWYGSLPRPLIERLLTMYAGKGAVVLDPFAGLGTTLDVAADMALEAVGLDVNPLACMVSRARLEGIPSKESLLKALEKISDDYSPADSSGQLAKFKTAEKYKYTAKWFREDVLQAVIVLLARISQVRDPQTQRLMFIGAAQIIREVASVDARCTHHLVSKKKPFQNPLAIWKKQVLSIASRVRPAPANPNHVIVIQESILRTTLKGQCADFVLLHPPYLGVIHYHLIHRLATDLLDFASSSFKPKSLRNLDFGYDRLKSSDISTDNEVRYLEAVSALAGQTRKLVRVGGRCAVIIGDQRFKGRLRHPFTDYVREFENAGFELEENFIWLLQNNGGMHVLRRGHFIDHNYILVFRLKG